LFKGWTEGKAVSKGYNGSELKSLNDPVEVPPDSSMESDVIEKGDTEL